MPVSTPMVMVPFLTMSSTDWALAVVVAAVAVAAVIATLKSALRHEPRNVLSQFTVNPPSLPARVVDRARFRRSEPLCGIEG